VDLIEGFDDEVIHIRFAFVRGAAKRDHKCTSPANTQYLAQHPPFHLEMLYNRA